MSITSPAMPSTTPGPGRQHISYSCNATLCIVGESFRDGGKGSFVCLSRTNSICFKN